MANQETVIGYVAIDPRRMVAKYTDGTRRRIEVLLVQRIEHQETYVSPGGQVVPVGDATHERRFVALDLRDGEFVDVTSDPTFDRLEVGPLP